MDLPASCYRAPGARLCWSCSCDLLPICDRSNTGCVTVKRYSVMHINRFSTRQPALGVISRCCHGSHLVYGRNAMSIVLEELTKRYDGHPVVNHLSLEVADGEFFVLLGSSGSGKTTVLTIIAGLTGAED